MMFKHMWSQLYWWAQRQAAKRRKRLRVAELKRRLAAHDNDIAAMSHFPQPVVDKMMAHRQQLVEQIETVQERNP